MKQKPLKNQIMFALMAVILVISTLIAVLGFYVIKKDILERAQVRVTRDLGVTRAFYNAEIERIGDIFSLPVVERNKNLLRKKLNLHYITVFDPNRQEITSEIVREAIEKKQGVGGTRIIKAEELEMLNQREEIEAAIAIVPTQRAKPTDKKVHVDVMSKEYAMPRFNKEGKIEEIIYGGRIINKDYAFVDKIRDLAFGKQMYDNKPVGTVTIFQGDTRIATNVLNQDGTRAIGTRVSEEVYQAVFEQGRIWRDRAFVVNDWYITAYEPIRNINGKIIGILYVGILEAPFDDMTKNIIIVFLVIVAVAAMMALALSFLLASAITKPLTSVLDAIEKLSGGAKGCVVESNTDVKELNELACSFNKMSETLYQREQSLRESNEKLTALNKSYLDLISFVSHELKGILASAIMNAYAVKDGFLGLINFKQRRALDSVARNLDYLSATVKKFLNLGRIEKGQLEVNRTEVFLKKEIFDTSIDSLSPLAVKKKIQIDNNIDPELTVKADIDLMQVVANNLISNAIKYGLENGQIVINSSDVEGKIQIEVYNDSVPISEEQRQKLFVKFSRLATTETKKVKGTGLGLYITKRIVESHGGDIWVEPGDNGNSFIFQIDKE